MAEPNTDPVERYLDFLQPKEYHDSRFIFHFGEDRYVMMRTSATEVEVLGRFRGDYDDPSRNVYRPERNAFGLDILTNLANETIRKEAMGI